MLFNLLAAETATSATSATSSNQNQPSGSNVFVWIILGVFIVGLIVVNYFSNKKRRAQMEAEKEKRNAIKPGFKVMTIGGIVGTVVAVDDEANTFVLQTGTDETPNYIKFDKVAIYSSEDPNAATAEPESENNGETAGDANENTEESSAEAKNETHDELLDVVEEPVAPVAPETEENGKEDKE
mgnify:CR=1 FL=1